MDRQRKIKRLIRLLKGTQGDPGGPREKCIAEARRLAHDPHDPIYADELCAGRSYDGRLIPGADFDLYAQRGAELIGMKVRPARRYTQVMPMTIFGTATDGNSVHYPTVTIQWGF
jgi:hypothetical protein